jgi:hypothetical protein
METRDRLQLQTVPLVTVSADGWRAAVPIGLASPIFPDINRCLDQLFLIGP